MNIGFAGEADARANPVTGWASWLFARLHAVRRAPPRLIVLERVALAPRQSLLLVEAEGRRFLVATSPQGAPALFPLGDAERNQSKLQDAAATQAGAGLPDRAAAFPDTTNRPAQPFRPGQARQPDELAKAAMVSW